MIREILNSIESRNARRVVIVVSMACLLPWFVALSVIAATELWKSETRAIWKRYG